METIDVFNSIAVIIVGCLLLLFRKQFIALTKFLAEKWYKKTGFFLYKIQIDNANTPSTRLAIIVVGLLFIIVGVLSLLKII